MLLDAICGEPREVRPQTDAAAMFVRLESSLPQIDAGERSIIAVALTEPDVVAVLHDRQAVFRAVEELRGRVLSLHGLLDVLRTAHGLAPAIAAQISRGYQSRYKASAPVWW